MVNLEYWFIIWYGRFEFILNVFKFVWFVGVCSEQKKYGKIVGGKVVDIIKLGELVFMG